MENTNYGPEIILSRSAPDFVRKLFSLEVSEIANGTVEIRSIAREPGYRTKLAVYSTDDKVDPVGACVGLRGQRVKNIVRELNNEKMDIIKWDADVETYITNALAPAQLDSFEIDDATKTAKILVIEDQLSLAIGKRGQNARLASRLTGWQINIEAKQSAAVSFEDKIAETIHTFAQVPGIDEELAKVLVHSGFHALSDLTQVEESDLTGIDGIGDKAGELLAAAKAELERQSNSLTDGSPESPAE